MRLVLLLALLVTPAHAADPALRDVALESLNADRKAEGRGALRLDETLNASALAHARDMLERGYFAHRGPQGSTPRSRYVAAGGSRFVVVGENIARCSGCSPADAARVRQLQRNWMDSPGHRENILDADFDRFGFAIAQGGGEQYAVQTFAGAGADEGDAVTATDVPAIAAKAVSAAREGEGVTANAALTDALSANASMAEAPDFAALRRSLGNGWRRLALLSATCGGCGSEVTAADVRAFVQQWEDGGRLATPATDLGFVAFADGEGRKRAFALLGQRF